MQKVTDNITLYHGSYCEVTLPELSKCGKYKDFGQGFYLTSSYEQATNFAKLSTRKAVANGIISKEQKYGYISAFTLFLPQKPELEICCFDKADENWLHCIVGHRKRNTFPEVVEKLKMYDVISGKIANDSTNATITAYMAGTYGLVGSETADKLCISFLLPDRLKDQFCFRTNYALKCLKFERSEQICL